MSVLIAIILLIALALLLLSSPSGSELSIKETAVEIEKTEVPVEPSRSEQTRSKIQEHSPVDSVKDNNISETEGSSGGDINQPIITDSQAPVSDPSSFNIEDENEDLIVSSDVTDQALVTDLSVSEAPKTPAVTASQQPESLENSQESPIPGDKEIAGLVQDMTGESVSDVSIQLRLQSPGPDATDDRLSRQAQSGLEGEFIFQNLPNGDYRLSVSPASSYGQVSHVTRAGTTDLILVLPDKSNVTIQGLVRDVNGQPLSNVSVSIDGKNETKTDIEGHYQISNTFEINSNHRLAFVLDGFREVNEFIKILSNEMTVDKQLQYKSQLALAGLVIDEYGLPLPKAAVWLYSRSAEIERRAKSDDSGNFTVDDLKPGSDYQFTVVHPGHKKYSHNSFEITEPIQPIRIELKSLSMGTLEGEIVNATGYPVPNYAMRIVNGIGSTGAVIITSDNSGKFDAVPVFEGVLQMNSISEPRSTVSGIKLAASQNLFLTLVVDHGDYDITGTVIDENGRGIANAKITMTWTHSSDGFSSRSNRFLRADEIGDFRIQNVGSGTHALAVAAQGYKNAYVDIIPEQHFSPLSVTLNR